jgi:hypothetical protein
MRPRNIDKSHVITWNQVSVFQEDTRHFPSSTPQVQKIPHVRTLNLAQRISQLFYVIQIVVISVDKGLSFRHTGIHTYQTLLMCKIPKETRSTERTTTRTHFQFNESALL